MSSHLWIHFSRRHPVQCALVVGAVFLQLLRTITVRAERLGRSSGSPGVAIVSRRRALPGSVAACCFVLGATGRESGSLLAPLVVRLQTCSRRPCRCLLLLCRVRLRTAHHHVHLFLSSRPLASRTVQKLNDREIFKQRAKSE